MPRTELAVLTGDIIKSSRLAPAALDAAMKALADAALAMSAWKGAQPDRFVRYRGDGWQCLAPSPALALRAALFLRANLRAHDRDIDTRISVGIGAGSISSGLAAATGLAAASGPAFEISGRGLEGMGHSMRFAVAWQNPPDDADLIQAVFSLCDEISRLWTQRQAEILIESLLPIDEVQEALAGRLGISQQAVAKHLRAGGDWALRRALAAMEGSEQ